jgi:hypothetical protein
MKDKPVDPNLKHMLEELQSVPPRDQQVEVRGKANFLSQASSMRSAATRSQEHNRGWFNTHFPLFSGRQRIPVFNRLVALVLALAVFFGGSGATVFAAQDSLPDQPLYPVKIWSEDTVISLSGSPLARLTYELDFSDRRLAEIAGLISSGNPVPAQVITRLQDELEQVLDLVSGMDDSQMEQQLSQLHLRAETQLQTINDLLSHAPLSAQPALQQAHARLQEQIQLCAYGQADPQGFRQQVQQRRRLHQGGSGNPTSGNGTQTPATIPMPSGNGTGPGSGGGGGKGSGSHTPMSTPMPSGTGSGSGLGNGNGSGSGTMGGSAAGNPNQGLQTPYRTP